jgi:hypothetical protein
MNAQIDRGAAEAGRNPGSIVRAYNVFGQIGADASGDPFRGTVSQWTDNLTMLAVEAGMDTFIYGAPDDDLTQTRRFAEEVVPAVREAVAEHRR